MNNIFLVFMSIKMSSWAKICLQIRISSARIPKQGLNSWLYYKCGVVSWYAVEQIKGLAGNFYKKSNFH